MEMVEKVLTPINSFVHKNLEVKTGDDFTELVLNRCRDYDRLRIEHTALKERAGVYEKYLQQIAIQKNCAETEADEEIPIGSDGKRMGDIEMGYDCIINDAREAIAWKPASPEQDKTLSIRDIDYCNPCGFPVDECNCPNGEKEGDNG
jgi:hypothetical protein